MFLLWLLFLSTSLWSAEQPVTTVDEFTQAAQLKIPEIKHHYPQPGQAAYILGIKFLHGYGMPTARYEDAFTYFIVAAIKSPSLFFKRAQDHIDTMLSENKLSDESIKKVLFEKKEPGLLQELAQGNILAFTFLNHLLENKYIKAELKTDIQKKVTETLKDAPQAVARMYQHLMPANLEQAIYLLTQLEKRYHNAYAAFQLGTLYDHGLYTYKKDIPVKKDLEKAFQHYKIAADAGIPEALCAVGKAYYFGEGTEPNVNLGLEYIEKAIGKKYAPAIMLLGNIYFFGSSQVQTNKAKAIEYYKKAKDLNYPEADLILGQMAFYGFDDNGVEGEPDYQKALTYFEKSKHAGVVSTNFYLGFFYKTGLYVPKDRKRAKELYQELINSPDPKTYDFQGLLYESGTDDIPKDLQKAQALYKKAIWEGEFFAQISLAIINSAIQQEAQTLRTPEPIAEQFEIPAIEKAQKRTPSKPSPEQVEDCRRKSAEKDFLVKLNNKFNCNDGSLVTEVNFEDGYIKVFRDSDKTEAIVTIDMEEKQRFKRVKKFVYQKRVRDRFVDLYHKNLTGREYNSMIRHAFPEMVDYICQLFGDKLTSSNQTTLVIGGQLIPGQPPKSSIVGHFVYGYNDNKKELDLYHRFLHREKQEL